MDIKTFSFLRNCAYFKKGPSSDHTYNYANKAIQALI